MKKNKAVLTCSILSLMLAQTTVLANSEVDDEKEMQKDETVYAILNADGTIRDEIISSWIHNESGIKNIKEVLDIQNVENVKGEEAPIIQNNTYTWNVEGSDLYYRGTSEKHLPVEISITYLLDGIAYKCEDLAGKSGKLEIRISFKNTMSKQVMIQGVNTTVHPLYLAAGIVDFSNDHFRNITCEHSKIISDGNQQIVSFFTLPGFEETLQSGGITDTDALPISDTYVIHADVDGFEMNPIMIAMTPEVPLDKLKSINSLDDLTNGIDQLGSAGMQLLDGTHQLSDATGLFAAKMNDLAVGVAPLNQGIKQLNSGMVQLYDGGRQLSDKTRALSDGIAQIKNGAQKLYEGTAALPKLSDGIAQLQQGADALNKGIQAMDQGVGALNSKAVASNQLNQLADILTELKGCSSLLSNMEQMLNGLENLNTSLNIGNGNPSDPGTPLPSVSTYTKTISDNSQTNAQRLAALCANLQTQGSDASLINDCADIAAKEADNAKQAVILNTIMNNDQQNGLAQQVNAMTASLKQIDPDALKQFSSQLADIDKAIDGVHELNEGIRALNAAMPQLCQGSQGLADGMDQLAQNGSRLNDLSLGAAQLYQGSKTLNEGSQLLYQGSSVLSHSLADAKNGVNTLYNSTPTLMGGITQLNSASHTLADKTAELDNGMSLFQTTGLDELQARVSLSMRDLNRIIAIKDAVIEENEQVHTFSGAPENADSKVKFIYKTAEIKQPQTEAIAKEQDDAEEQSWWDRIVSFFSDLF